MMMMLMLEMMMMMMMMMVKMMMMMLLLLMMMVMMHQWQKDYEQERKGGQIFFHKISGLSDYAVFGQFSLNQNPIPLGLL